MVKGLTKKGVGRIIRLSDTDFKNLNKVYQKAVKDGKDKFLLEVRAWGENDK